MHICLVTPRLPPSRCGVGDYTQSLALELVAQGHQVTLLTASDQLARDPQSGMAYHNLAIRVGLQ